MSTTTTSPLPVACPYWEAGDWQAVAMRLLAALAAANDRTVDDEAAYWPLPPNPPVYRLEP